MRIYTRTGDTGETGLFGGSRVRKDDLRIEAIGAVDELNAFLGTVIPRTDDTELRDHLFSIQEDLFALGADLATPEGEATRHGRASVTRLNSNRTGGLESLIDCYEAELPPLTRFILPGGHPLAAALHLARTVCRRAERRSVALSAALGGEEPINPEILRYLNRLSDLLFVLARLANCRLGVEETIWRG